MHDLGTLHSRDFRHVGHAVLITCSVAAFFLTLAIAFGLGLSSAEPTERMRYHALPVAISQLYHGQEHDYTANWQVAMAFQTPGQAVKDVINATVGPSFEKTAQVYFWTADDRGLADFVYGAFVAFGPHLTSLFYFWFLVLGTSLALALIAFRRDPFALAVIASAMVAVGVLLPVYTHANAGLPVHISESRMFDPLGGVALFHLLLSIFRPIRTTMWLHGLALLLQAALLGFLFHTRTTLVWILLSVAVVSLTITFVRFRKRAPLPTLLQAVAPAILIVAAWAGVLIYQSAAMHRAYLTEIGPRTVWHNILIGLIQSPTFSKELQITEFSDGVAADAVLLDMRQRGDPRLGPGWTRDNIMNSLGGHARFNWVAYESAARSLVLRTLIDHPKATLELALWQKPKRVFQALLCETLRLVPSCGHHRGLRDFIYPSRRAGLLSAFWLLLAAAIGIGLATSESGAALKDVGRLASWTAAIACALSIALLPSYVFYAGPMQLAGAAFLIAFAFYFACVVITALLVHQLACTRGRAL